MKVSNFRCFKDVTTVALDDLVVLIGKNDSGKSSLLDTMNIFFNGVPEQDDLCVHATDQKLTIICVFDDFPKQLVIDEQYHTDLAAEYLLNKEGKLEIAMVFNCTGSGKVKPASVLARANHPT
ncbi:MAG: AAA family ATPase, partial [Terriglobia bacterium]